MLALKLFGQFVVDGISGQGPLTETRLQLILGNDEFVELHRRRLPTEPFTAVMKEQRRMAAMSLSQYRSIYPNREEAMFRGVPATDVHNG